MLSKTANGCSIGLRFPCVPNTNTQTRETKKGIKRMEGQVNRMENKPGMDRGLGSAYSVLCSTHMTGLWEAVGSLTQSTGEVTA